MNDRERITRLEIRCEQLQLTVNEAFHWIDILKSDLSDLQDKVGYADRKTEPTISKMEQVEDEPQTEPLQTCSVNGRPYTDCCNCEYFKCTADEPQTERKE